MEIKKGDILLDLYEVIDDPIESGKTSRVWKVRHKEWDILMALKEPREAYLLDAERAADFRSECRSWINLGMHPHIVSCYYVREIGNKLVLFADWCDGGSLAENIKSRRLYEGTTKEIERRIASIAMQTALGLRYVHAKGDIHNDIKPGNIMLTKEGEARISDFGSAGTLSKSGTPQYCSPEQITRYNCSGQSDITTATDIYSWALTVIEMYADEAYWDKGPDAVKYYYNFLSEFRIVIEPRLRELIMKCLDENPDNRPSAEMVVMQLERIYGDILKDDIALNYIDEYSDRESPDSLNNRALSYVDIGEYDKAEKCWEKSLKLHPFHPETVYNYNVYLWSHGRLSDTALQRQVEMLNSPLKNEFTAEINRYTGAGILFAADHKDDKRAQASDLRFSKNGKKILAAYENLGIYIVWDSKNLKSLDTFPINTNNIERATKEKWCEPIRWTEDNRALIPCPDDPASSIIKEIDSERYISTISGAESDVFSFSPDGKYLAYNDMLSGVTIATLPEKGVPKPVLCKFISPVKMLEYKRSYDRLKEEYVNSIKYMDYASAVEIIHKIGDIPCYSQTPEYRYMKKILFPVCKRKNYTAYPASFYPYGILSAEFSPDGKRFLTVAYIEAGIPDSNISIWNTADRKELMLVSPIENEPILSAWFETDSIIKFTHGPLFAFDESPAVSLTAYDIDADNYISSIEYPDGYSGGYGRPHNIPEELKQFCENQGYNSNVCDINPDYTVMITGTDYESVIFEIDSDIEFDKEKAETCKRIIYYDYKDALGLGTVFTEDKDAKIDFDIFDDDDENEWCDEDYESHDDEENYDDIFPDIILDDTPDLIKPLHDNVKGFENDRAFLLDYLSVREYNTLASLAKRKLENPYTVFRNKCIIAKDWIDAYNGFDVPNHEDEYVQTLIDYTDEEFRALKAEITRRASFWEDQKECDFFTIYSRMLTEKQSEPVKKEEKTEDTSADFSHGSATGERRVNFLPKLASKIQNMRTHLLNTVLGQDHIVHAFCEGIFNSEVLIHSDTERVCPRAVFTFAGPPGVGKTYLAEQAAKYLGKPVKRFDMTEYSSHNSHLGLIGFEYTWKDSTPGELTSFVRDNPTSILIFDEIEKAHPQVIQVFFQMLGSGIVTDRYYSTQHAAAEANPSEFKDKPESQFDGKVSFTGTVIIFTTNAGRSLYEGEYAANCASVSTKTLLNALTTEINPLTKEPFFPTAIVSRIATGYPMLFNNLGAHNLVGIIEKEFSRVQELFRKQYGITINADKEVMLSLLFSEGGSSDARVLRAKVETFFKNEFFRIFSSQSKALNDIVKYTFTAETHDLPEKINRVFHNSDTPEILIYSNKSFARLCEMKLNDFIIHSTQSIEDAMRVAGEKDITLALIDIAHRTYDAEDETENDATMLFSMAANSWKDGKELFRTLHSRMPELPIYLLESTTPLSEELVTGFIRSGARGKLTEPDKDDYEIFSGQLERICSELYMQSVAEDIAAEHKMLYFETAPKIVRDEVVVSLRNFELQQIPDADDAADIVSETEKPKERFNDVIGAENAKKELTFFVNFLKNPKKFIAQGHSIPKGVLLYGKPGTGKTMLARAMAGESDVTFIASAASNFVKQYTGTGPAAVRELFRKARRYAPSIIFIDEVDTIAKQRTGSENAQQYENTLNALLAEMDGFVVDPKRPVFVLAATNYGIDENSDGIGVLDEAFMRRFDRTIRIDLPNTEERKQLLSIMLSKVNGHLVTEEMINTVASRSIGISPAILTRIVNTAKRLAFDAGEPLNDSMLEEAFELIRHGEKKEWEGRQLERTARHECGHALISILGGNTPAYITIEARGGHGGYMEYPEKVRNAYSMTKNELIWQIRTALGGRAAEIVCYGDEDGLTTGASSDLEKATWRIKSMIVHYGMDKQFGLAAMSAEEAEKSPELRARVNEILNEELDNTVRLISENKEMFDALCKELLLKNRLMEDEINRLIKK